MHALVLLTHLMLAGGFTQGTPSAGGASPLTTKGDLYTYTSADARLGVGDDGNCLKADSTQPTGLIWGACATGASHFVEVDVDFGTGGNTTAKTVVTGAEWVSATSKIVCAATAYAATGRLEGAEDAIIEGIIGTPSNRVAGVGFTLTASPRFGKALSTYKFNCTGN